MKIKTIFCDMDSIGRRNFDKAVNERIAEGWILGKRDVIPGVNLGDRHLMPQLYAELVMLDPAPEVDEPQPLDPVEALRAVREFCGSNQCEGCSLEDFCTRHLLNNEGPADWEIPGEEVPEA